MRIRNLIIGLTALFGILASSTFALPADTTVEYNHKSAGATVWRVEIDLHPESGSGGTIEWSCVEIRHIQLGIPVLSWTDSNCSFDSSSGYWSVAHADPLDPDRTDFTSTPGASGTASADFPLGVSIPYTWSQGYGGSLATSYLDYIYGPPSNPIKDGDDEPVDVPGPISNPFAKQ